MSDFRAFLAENAIKADNVKCVVSERFLDANKELRTLTSDENAALVKSCKRKSEPTAGNREVHTYTDGDAYNAKLVAACVVYPK